eukprot:jgi/Chlat1/4770/Chrsp308S04742
MEAAVLGRGVQCGVVEAAAIAAAAPARVSSVRALSSSEASLSSRRAACFRASSALPSPARLAAGTRRGGARRQGVTLATVAAAESTVEAAPATTPAEDDNAPTAAELECPVPLESEAGVSYEKLRRHLARGEWELADEETRMTLCRLAGDGAAARKWVYFSEVQFITATDLKTIDALWRHFSNEKFGFSVQKKIWVRCGRDWGEFFQKLDWTTVKNRSYRKFPQDYIWDLETAAVGHLPLTNALRGTQLLEALFKHPAFDKDVKETSAKDAITAPVNTFSRFTNSQ